MSSHQNSKEIVVADYRAMFEREFDQIPEARHAALSALAGYIRNNLKDTRPSNLVFICTHNSRHSHMAQLWAQAAAYAYGVGNVYCFSGGTEATAFNPLRAGPLGNPPIGGRAWGGRCKTVLLKSMTHT